MTHLLRYDALEAQEAISGMVLLAQGEDLHVAARRVQSDGSVWHDPGVGERVPSADALRSPTPVFYREGGESKVHSADLFGTPELLALDTPVFAAAVQTGAPVFVIAR